MIFTCMWQPHVLLRFVLFFLGTLNLNYEVSWRNFGRISFTASYFKMEVTEYKEHLINPRFQGISSMQ